MINRLFTFTRAAASGATFTSFLCAYHCYHYTNECSVTERAAMERISVYDAHADQLERTVLLGKATGDRRIAMEILAARRAAAAQ